MVANHTRQIDVRRSIDRAIESGQIEREGQFLRLKIEDELVTVDLVNGNVNHIEYELVDGHPISIRTTPVSADSEAAR